MHQALQNHYLLVDGVNLHYVRSGKGQPVVLLHGNDGTLKDFTMSIFGLVAEKYDALAFDRPGHGLSKVVSARNVTPELQARVLHSALQKLGVKRPILVGHSWSSSLALSYALEYQEELCGLVLLGGLAFETTAAKPICHLAQVPLLGTSVAHLYKVTGKKQVKRQLQDAFSPENTPNAYEKEFLSSMFRVGQLKAAARDEVMLNQSLRRISSQYSKIKLPVLILTGDRDRVVAPEEHSYPLHKAIPHSRLIVLKNAGHQLHFTRQQEVMQAIDSVVQLSVGQDPSATLQPVSKAKTEAK
jgi:pimeloyl-ACP methyl ester carboxylesterase